MTAATQARGARRSRGRGSGRPAERRLHPDALLLLPAAVLFVLLLLVPLALLLATSFNPSARGTATLEPVFTLENYVRLLTTGVYAKALWNSVLFGGATALLAVVLGYPIAYVMANTADLRRLTLMTILLLVPFQIDVTVRVVGLIVLLGDNGLVNGLVTALPGVERSLPLMYNRFGVLVGTTQFMLPFVVFALIGALKGIDPALVQAARSLGAPFWRAFRAVVLPLSLPGIAAAMLVAFTLTVSNFTIPVLMSSYQEQVLPSLMHEQVAVVANLRFAAAMGVVLLLVALVTVVVGFVVIRRVLVGGRAR